MRAPHLWLALIASLPLAACNWVGNVSGLNAEANKALGASCRQTDRSLEECFRRHPQADQAQIFAGWKEMNEYMTKHKLQSVKPLPDPPKPPPAKMGQTSSPPPEEEKLDPEVEALMSTLGNKRSEAAAVARKKDERLISIINGTTEKVDPNEKPLPIPMDEQDADIAQPTGK